MISRPVAAACQLATMLLLYTAAAPAQLPPYDVFPEAGPPYYRIRYEGATASGALIFPVNYTVWIPSDVQTLRGVIVHQHGCGEGSCKSGLTGAFDLHWQALAKRHDCALLAPAYEQPQDADCQMGTHGWEPMGTQHYCCGNPWGHSIIVEIVFEFQYPADCWFRFFGGLWVGTHGEPMGTQHYCCGNPCESHGDTALLLQWFSGFNTLPIVGSGFSEVCDGSVGSC